jgi:hypothetical protein
MRLVSGNSGHVHSYHLWHSRLPPAQLFINITTLYMLCQEIATVLGLASVGLFQGKGQKLMDYFSWIRKVASTACRDLVALPVA